MKTFFNIVESENNKRIDLFGENWYKHNEVLYPSVTFIQSATHVNKQLAKYLQEFGESASKDFYRKGEIGTELHRIIDFYLQGNEIAFYDLNPKLDDEMKIDVWQRFDNFMKFDEKVLSQFEVISTEQTVINESVIYAGTLDCLTKDKNGLYHIWDWKTSEVAHKEHKSQISAYAFALNIDIPIETANIVCIHGANSKTKHGYSLTTLNEQEIENYFELFIWYKKAFEREIKTPLIKSLPISYKRD